MNKEDIKIGDYVYTNWQRKYIIAKVLEIRGETIYGILELVSKLPEEKTDESVHNIELNTDETFLGHLNVDEIYKLNFKNEMISCCRLKYDNLNSKNIKVGDYVYVKDTYYRIYRVESIKNNSIMGHWISRNRIPNNKVELEKIFKYSVTHPSCRSLSCEYVEKIKFEDEKIKEYQQQILDKMTVLNSLINLSLDIGNKEAFEGYCKEYNEISERLNNNKMEVV